MSIATEIERLLNAKAEIKKKIETDFDQTIPSSAKVGDYPSYMFRPKPTANGIYIRYTDGSYSNYDSLSAGKTPVGVAVKTSSCSFCLHPSHAGNETSAYQTDTTLISGITTTTSRTTAEADFAGKSNTDAMISSGKAGAAFTWARNVVYADGSVGWLPSGGEFMAIKNNVANINTALTLIGGNTIAVTSSGTDYWTSTQYNYRAAWHWSRQQQKLYDYSSYDEKYWTFNARSITDF